MGDPLGCQTFAAQMFGVGFCWACKGFLWSKIWFLLDFLAWTFDVNSDSMPVNGNSLGLGYSNWCTALLTSCPLLNLRQQEGASRIWVNFAFVKQQCPPRFWPHGGPLIKLFLLFMQLQG